MKKSATTSSAGRSNSRVMVRLLAASTIAAVLFTVGVAAQRRGAPGSPPPQMSGVSTDAMAKIPRRLLAHSQGAFELIRRNAFLGFAHQISSGEPFRQWQVGVMEYRPAGCGELIAA